MMLLGKPWLPGYQHTLERGLYPAWTVEESKGKTISLYSRVLQLTHILHVQRVKLLKTKSFPYLLV